MKLIFPRPNSEFGRRSWRGGPGSSTPPTAPSTSSHSARAVPVMGRGSPEMCGTATRDMEFESFTPSFKDCSLAFFYIIYEHIYVANIYRVTDAKTSASVSTDDSNPRRSIPRSHWIRTQQSTRRAETVTRTRWP